MTDLTRLPAYPGDELANFSLSDLTGLMIGDEDRVPRNVIDECARRGDTMVEHLSSLADDGSEWLDETAGEWWLKLHAVMILGLIPSARAGLLLIKFMHRMSQEEDDDLQDWLAGYWPGLFRNKPASVLPALRELCDDRAINWYIRTGAIQAYVGAMRLRGSDALEQALEWLAGQGADEQEDWELRLCSGNMLLDFPRVQYRPLLEGLAARQSGLGRLFSENDIRLAYATMQDKVERDHFEEPWNFYSPDAIAARQQRWTEENAKKIVLERRNDHGYGQTFRPEPYTRTEPKVGRNDPCPCGSGRKYKKCCMGKE
jgi:hypothetical protein